MNLILDLIYQEVIDILCQRRLYASQIWLVKGFSKCSLDLLIKLYFFDIL